ncbi:GDSL-type esterase/lipase family protein [Maribellus sp. YY47]|uniref:GDSL-type esterase/lipase family protein n=1 Tax=Maribellus sp. YY47 TaxID=2929486 RepID=UPI002001D6C4|nr:GDSL-type esterase/lipase family protein [Maribellus sp. YY47]MCK3685736.1 GDSL-type esterase/lipase family protein [Maribellus sp. YY47]
MNRTKKYLSGLVHLTLVITAVLFLSCTNEKPLGDVFNKGVPGNNTADLLRRVSTDVVALQPDLVVVMVGTNDLLNTRKMLSVGEYYNNMDLLTDSLLRHNISVIVVSPPTADSLHLFERHDSTLYPATPMKLLEAGSDTLRALCEKKDLVFVDLFSHLKEMGIPEHERDQIIRNRANSDSNDGIHFTKEGNYLLARFIYEHLVANFDGPGSLKIVCFGDSITCGVFMEGKGTTEGDTYPAVLKRLIKGESPQIIIERE